MAKKASKMSTGRVQLRPHDAFDLIRLLARSQSDPRKAVAELVQNSLDAGARNIELVWFTKDKQRALRIWDDGVGVFPEMEREEALRRIAHTIGYSHKRGLSPAQRKEQMIQGQYGIGLIGFWSVGQLLEMKSRVAGGQAWTLRMYEDQARGDVQEVRARRVEEEQTYTQISILGLHQTALGKIRPPRLQAYLAAELRGQLLEREATVRIIDRVARGRARKLFVVEPRPYLGQPLEQWREFEVPGFESARVELYSVSPDEERRGFVTLSCGGTIVLDDIAEIDGADQPRKPWSQGLFEGVIDFPELHVAPGTRRGFAHNEPVAAFLAALETLEAELVEHLAQESSRRTSERQENLAQDIRKAFRNVANRLPDYDFFSVDGKMKGASGSGSGAGSGPGVTPGKGHNPDGTPAPPGEALHTPDASEEQHAVPGPGGPEPSDTNTSGDPETHLFPPGPLAKLELRPRILRLPPLATRTLRARALDADGRPASGQIDFAWHLEGAGDLQVNDAQASYTTPEFSDPEDPPIFIHLTATQGEIVLTAKLTVTLQPGSAGSARTSGIPEPHPIHAPGAAWRSRLTDQRWEYNADHKDYQEACHSEARRLRYLVNLFAKEIVLRNFGGPADGEVLERMVEVLTYLDRGSKR